MGAFFVASSEQSPLRGQWWQWAPRVRDRSPNMPLLEALTLLRALQELELHHRLRPGQILPWFTDCDPARRAVKRGYSPKPDLNRIVTAIHAYDVVILPCWIPTDINLADPYSRRHDFVPPFTEIPLCLQGTPLWAYVTHPSYKGILPPRRRG